ncbi:hypothetical protein HIM_11343 [Hirsutella minnesotensis 3608]|uniref:chitinase n=1 Tax=Hirsutella minnesotensis 3608 TaxID=1043627 RepID=A0A0F8A1B7_9HYPO|nr:hypothetical protein HIM_11343 [Hirsutella minnesotensis 3608]
MTRLLISPVLCCFVTNSLLATAAAYAYVTGNVSSEGLTWKGSLLSTLEAFPPNDPWARPLTNGCPTACEEAGPRPTNWTRLYRQDQLSHCNKPMLFDFNVERAPNNDTTFRACALGPDPNPVLSRRLSNQKLHGINMIRVNHTVPADMSVKEHTFDLSCGASGSTVKASIKAGPATIMSAGDILSAMEVLEARLSDPESCGNLVLFAKAGAAVVGLYAGADLQKKQAARLLTEFRETVEICDPKSNFATTLGLVVVEHIEDISRAQRAVQVWTRGSCLDSPQSRVLLDGVNLDILAASPLDDISAGTEPRTDLKETPILISRSECRSIEVAEGEGCAALSTRCGIRGREFIKFNPKPSLCATLKPGQKVCCSEGELSSAVPEQQRDGTCATHKVIPGDTCDMIANVYEITLEEIVVFNSQTWGWTGCGSLQVGTVMCLTQGSPPLPAPVPGIECGPQKPGTEAPSGTFTGEDLAKLNPCALNACCSRWGFCGASDSFCGKPSLKKGAPGTGSCISNCGYGTVTMSKPPPEFIKIGYFEGYGISRPCDNVDVRTINLSKYTHLHFAFATVAADTYDVDMGPVINQFHYFKQLEGVKKILAFGGWAFSTDPGTYGTFRTGVQSQNRIRMADKIARFIIDNDLDGVDFDWEYPAAPDIPDIPPGSPEEGLNYLRFLITVRQLLPAEKTVSIAAPASYWYLKGFPMQEIMKYIDYAVYMTYDLHGQWDYGNKWATEGCPAGNCIRSHVNMTETMRALGMLTKAGVPTNKVVVGVTSYGRSFELTDAGCTGFMCTYTGPQSGAKPGKCTGTSGYLSNFEIQDIIKNDPTAKTSWDDDSKSNILVYGSTQWVAYMDDDNKKAREEKYKGMNFLGTSDWAIDLDPSAVLSRSEMDAVMADKNTSFGPASAVTPTYDDSCEPFVNTIKQAWIEAGELSKAPYAWNRWNKYQNALNTYLSPLSSGLPWTRNDEWHNFENHYFIHHGGWRSKSFIHVTFYCDKAALPAEAQEKIKGNPNVCRWSPTKRWGTTARTFRFPGTFYSNYYILLCPMFLGTQKGAGQMTSLTAITDEAKAYKPLRTHIDRWSTSVRAVTIYHEVSHFQDVSWPFCNANELYATEKIAANAIHGGQQGYDFNLRNAHTWALSATAMYMMQQWSDVDVPMPNKPIPDRAPVDSWDAEAQEERDLWADVEDVDVNLDVSRMDPGKLTSLSRHGWNPKPFT